MGMKGKEYFCAPRSTHITNLGSVPCHSCVYHIGQPLQLAVQWKGKHSRAAVAQPSTQPTSQRTAGIPGGRGTVVHVYV